MGAGHNNNGLNDQIQDDGAFQENSISSNFLYRSLFSNHPDIVYHLDVNGNIVEANASFTKVLGYAPEEISNDLSQLYTENQLQTRMDYFNKAKQGETQNFNLSASNKEGSIVELNIIYIPNLLNGRVYGIFGIAKDITEQVNLQHTLQEQKQWYESLFEHHPDAVCYFDVHGMFLDCNASLALLLGYSKEELIHSSFPYLIHQDHLTDVCAHFEQAAKGQSQRYNTVAIHKDGHLIDVNVTNLPIYVDGQIVGVYGIARDITDKKRSERLLAEREQRYRSLFDYHPDSIFYYDVDGRVLDCNGSLVELMGYSVEELRQFDFQRIAHPDLWEQRRNYFINTLQGNPQKYDTIAIHKDGRLFEFHITLLPIVVNGEVIGVYAIARNITDGKRAERALLEAETKYRSIVETSVVGVYIIQNDKFIYTNPRLCQMLGYDGSMLANSVVRTYIHPDDLEAVQENVNQLKNEHDHIHHEFRAIKQDGGIIDVEVHSARIFYQGQSAVIGTMLDITERIHVDRINKYMAYHDSLTELPNRRFFEEQLEQSLALADANNRKLAVMYLDMDRFKYVNDSLGHALGDQILKQLSRRIKECVGEDGIVARMGGDEFTVLLPEITGTDDAVSVAKAIIHSLKERFEIEAYELFITTSIGISIFPADGSDSKTLLKNADSALYRAKEMGKNDYQIYNSSMNIHSYKLYRLEKDLRHAIQRNELELYYQAKIDPNSGLIVGAEALLRWNHPEWGLVPPSDFIPLAEETGLIAHIGKWVKQTVCIQNKAWQQDGLRPIPISINISAKRFMHKDTVDNIRSILSETQLEPQFLEIEITESSLLENEEIVSSTINQLKAIGVKIALDDFGTGYSSLSYLKRFKQNIDTLKIDRSFIQDLSEDNPDKEIVEAIINLAHHLNMTVVAEGVEDVQQLALLRKQQCDEIQGYLFSKPVPANQFAQQLRAGKLEPSDAQNGQSTAIRENQRRYFRISLPVPLGATMTIARLKGKALQLGKTDVLIEDIGPGGLRFLSFIKLAVHPEIVLEIETEIIGSRVKLYGEIVWLRELQDDLFQYGVEFSMDEDDRASLCQLLNQFSIKLKRNSLVPGCSFIHTDKVHYLRSANLHKPL